MALYPPEPDPVRRGQLNRARMRIKSMALDELTGRTDANGQTTSGPGRGHALLTAALDADLDERQLDRFLTAAHDNPTAEPAALVREARGLD